MLDQKRTRPPRQAAPGMQTDIGSSSLDYTLRAGAVNTLDNELAIVIAAADRLAGGHGLAHDDYNRLHQAHQFLIQILASLRNKEVLV